MTQEEALKIASNYGYEEEVQQCMEHGDTPEEALYEWDILPDYYYDGLNPEEGKA